jgi:hypothetical protein
VAEFEKRLACVIKADGTVARGHMIDACRFDGGQSIQNPLAGTPTAGSKDQFCSNDWQRIGRTGSARADHGRPKSGFGRDASPYL